MGLGSEMNIQTQLQQDITSFDKQIKLLDTKLKELIGAKMYIIQLLDKLKKEEEKEK